MIRRRDYCHFIWVLMMLITYTSCEHIPTKPIVEYDSDKSVIQIVQTDTAAHDSAFISIGSIYQSVIPIKDTVSLSITGTIKKLNQIEVAYKLARKYDVEMPIVEHVNKILFDDYSAKDALHDLITRDRKKEASTLTWNN